MPPHIGWPGSVFSLLLDNVQPLWRGGVLDPVGSTSDDPRSPDLSADS